ncbi:hypothetical protein GCM10009868_15360 [Terrabacter aerolatus]|uniref:Uncharacterized protein n=1 Tax=Terrabacter aerolatus TaxID=422442 RepID=A0A512D735_9MICO|nr:hypothetical protein [Terrabacter aerolatus]GEO32187.1 hypothetical protein TAE01_39970 [Terrabacter aerolatus]
MDTPDISVAELRSALTRLLDATEERFGADLRFPEDPYWNVPFSEATVLDREPKLDMGSVVDDAASVRECLTSDPDEYVSIWHEADHIVGLLRAIARLDSPR